MRRCGDPRVNMSREQSFTTPQASGPTAFPQRIGIIGDLGQTYNSSETLSHLIASEPPVNPTCDLTSCPGAQSCTHNPI